MHETIQNASRPEVGAILAGKYRVMRVLGEGVLGIVFEAVNIRLGQRVAIKVPQPPLLARAEAVERFARDVRAAARLRSRNAVRVIDAEATESGIPFMVMELLEGRNLELELAERGALPVNEAVGYVRQACSALVEAHSHGIVHGGLKPSNLFVAQESDGSRCIKVLNLGVFRPRGGPRDSAGPGPTSDEVLYLAPEQVQASKVVDPRCDVWALGAILYELLSGRPPVWESSSNSSDLEPVRRRVKSLTLPKGELPPRLKEVVSRALEPQPEDRFASAQAMLAALTPSAWLPGPDEPFLSAKDAGGRAAGASPPGQRAVPAKTRAPAHGTAVHPRWRHAALLTPVLVLAATVYMTRCNDRQPALDDARVTTTVLTLSPGDERRSVPAADAGRPQASTLEATVEDVADAAAPLRAEPTGLRRFSATEEAIQPVIEPSEAPRERSEPRRRQTPNPSKGAEAAVTVRSGVKPRAVPAGSSVATSPPSTPTPRVWDEDSPIPP